MAGNWKDVCREFKTSTEVLKIGRNVAWESLSLPKPTDLSEVPPSPDALVPEYLTQVLCKDHPEAKVESVQLGQRSSGSGSRCSFTVSYNSAGQKLGLPTKLFQKSQEGFFQRLQQSRLKIDRSESAFYEVIRPEVNIETPIAYHSAYDHESGRMSVIMEDVIDSKGAEFFEVDTPISKSDVEGMLILLADLHSKYWESERLDTEFHWLFSPERYAVLIEEGMELAELTQNGLRKTEQVLPKEILGRAEEILPAFYKSMAYCSRGPKTYIIGDSHLRNFYKTKGGSIGFADWQVTQKGLWSFDFTYTLLTSLPIEKRRLWEKDLLKFYCNRLKENGVNAPKFEDAWEAYRRSTMFTFVGWLLTIGYGALQPAMQTDEAATEIVKRSGAAVLDLGSLDLLLSEDYGNQLEEADSIGIQANLKAKEFANHQLLNNVKIEHQEGALSYLIKLNFNNESNKPIEFEATFNDLNLLLEELNGAMLDLVEAARLKEGE